MFQRWHDLLFAHWPVDAEALRSRLPGELELDLHAGRAWLGIVPFRMSAVRLRGMPPLPHFSAFPEVNVRTYVRAGAHRGVWFFSLDAANRLAVRAARRCVHLPYFDARIECRERAGAIEYRAKRFGSGPRPAEFAATYRPFGPALAQEPGSFAEFATARYCLFTTGSKGELLRLDIHHPAWQLQACAADIERASLASAAGFQLPHEPPILHFARRMDVLFWRPQSTVP